MKPPISLFLKIFFYMGTGYGGTQLLTGYFFEGKWAIGKSLILGLIFGLMSATFFVYRQVRELKKIHGNKLHNVDFSVHQTALLQLPLSKEQIVAKLQNNFPSKDWEIAESGSQIKLKTTFSWKSFGERITIKVNKLPNEFSEITLESKPKNPVTFVDYGKNLENIIYLKNLLAA